MIIKSFPLIRPSVFTTDFRSIDVDPHKLLVRPSSFSICAADLRYYFGLRPSEVLRTKLPMVLIHEAIGRVIKTCDKNIPVGTRVILLPCGTGATPDSNYQTNAFFRSSNADGFCQEMMNLSPEEVLPISVQDDPDPFVFCELLSVCFQALRQIEREISASKAIAIWGDGSLGYLMAFVISTLYPDIILTIIGKHEDKLEKFTFADKIETIFSRSKDKYDLMIECVGGTGSQNAIEDMIQSARAKATILLTGVSENPPAINTRMILEKGITLRGTTRSIRADFEKANEFLRTKKNRELVNILRTEVIEVKNEVDLKTAFEKSRVSKFKTVISFRP